MSKTVEEILATEFSEEFVRGMQKRMLVSFHKYGALAEAFPHKIDATASLMDRLRYYMRGDEKRGIEPGNTEWLMDVANFAMIEFMHPRHERAHFQGTDDDASPGRISRKHGGRDKRPNVDLPSVANDGDE